MAIKETGVIYPPDSPELLCWETDSKHIAGKKYGLYNILTGKRYKEGYESDAIMQYSIYLLEQIRLNFGNYNYGITFNPPSDDFSGVRSLDLARDLMFSDGLEFMDPAEEYLMRHSNEYTRESIGKLMIELANARHIKCGKVEYLRAMANLHFRMVHNGHSPEKALDIVRHDSIRDSINREALDAVKRFTHK